MIITCDACNVRFQLDESVLKPTGSKVRCSKCKHVFTAYPPELQPTEEPEPSAVPDMTSAEEPAESVAGEAPSQEQPGSEMQDVAEAEAGGEFRKTSELDISDLNRMMADEEEAATEPPAVDEQAEAEDAAAPTEAEELDLDLDFEEEEEASGKEAPQGLDLGEDPSDGAEEDDLDLDLDFDLEEEPEAAPVAAAEVS
jgi:predicted Zn finger-like uncharacterized protein